MPSILHALILSALFGCAAVPQAAAPATSAPVQGPATRPREDAASAPASRPGDPAAKAFLAEAARHRAPAGEPEILDVTIRFMAETNFQDHNEFEAEHQFLRPNLSRMKVETKTTKVERGFDGTSFWLRSGGQLRRLEGREHTKDRQDIEASTRFTENMLRLTSLKSLSEVLTDMEKLPPDSQGRPGVRGRIKAFPTLRSADAKPAVLELRFSPKELDLVEARAVQDPPAEVPETYVFSDYKSIQGTRFPFRIEAFTTSRDRVEYLIGIRSVSWNDKLTPEQFTAPDR